MNLSLSLLVVDDDPIIHDSLKLLVGKSWKITSVFGPASEIPDEFFHAAFVDLHLTGNIKIAEGPSVITKLKEQSRRLEVVAMSGDLNMDLMESCLKAGARQFLAKPLMASEVTACLDKIEALWDLREIEQKPSKETTPWIGSSEVSESIRQQISFLRGEKGSILITGETGTGKEVVARLLHSQEKGRPFVAVNMASIPENLFESELFGHVKGAFTGADSNKIGLLEAAQGGDLFLDEIEALPMAQQAKLLRFLESKEVRKVGGKESIKVETRIITATNIPLEKMVKEGLFREDLLYRLKSQVLNLAPLRERAADIAELATYFLKLERPRINKMWTPEALDSLKKHSWPGNVRELKRLCEQVALSSPLPFVRPEDISRHLGLTEQGLKLEISTSNLDWSMGLEGLLAEFEKNVILKCLSETPELEKCLEKLKISRSGFYKKIKDYQIEVPS